MLLERIDNDDLSIIEAMHYPVAFMECMIDDVDAMHLFTENRFSHVRNGQLFMLSYEYMVDAQDPTLTVKENFKRLETAGSVYCLGARKFGKSVFVLIMDMLMSVVHLDNWTALYSSYDALHIQGIIERVITAVQRHPIFNAFLISAKRAPNYILTFLNGFTLQSVNTNIGSKTAGSNFFGHHVKKLYTDEISKETNEVEAKRIDAVSEVGCIDRFAGMTDFTRHSPAGRIFYDSEKKKFVCNFSQYVSPMWDESEKAKQTKKYSGEKTINYRVFVGGEVVEDGISVFDMQRVKACIDDRKTIKNFEINKENFSLFKNIIVAKRPSNADLCAIAADIGETAATEITIWFKINDKWHYTYNISIYNLTDKEQYQVLKWLWEKLKCDYYSNDNGEGTGRAIFRRLEEDFGKEKMVHYAGTNKVAVGIKKDDNDRVIMQNGQPQTVEEFMSEWAVKHLKDLFYEQLLVLPQDYKLEAQINSVISTTLSNRVVYTCLAQEDHLFDAFRVFAILHFMKDSEPIVPKQVKKFGKGCGVPVCTG